MKTTVEKVGERELVVTRTFDAPARIVWDAWTKPELIKKWWAPKSMGQTLMICETDVRPGGAYRYVFGKDGKETMTFFGKYVEVTPNARLVWTNEESGPDQGSVTTLTFEEKDGKTLLVMRDLFPTKEAFEEGAGFGEGLANETHAQLDELLATLV